jgi:hypothetical protein
MNIKNIEIPAKVKAFFNTTGKVVVIAASMVVGFGAAQLYNYVTKKDEKPATIQVNPGKGMKETSIAVNERNELMIIDRQNGSYQIYSDSVGHAIFNLYAGQLYAKMSQK